MGAVSVERMMMKLHHRRKSGTACGAKVWRTRVRKLRGMAIRTIGAL